VDAHPSLVPRLVADVTPLGTVEDKLVVIDNAQFLERLLAVALDDLVEFLGVRVVGLLALLAEGPDEALGQNPQEFSGSIPMSRSRTMVSGALLVWSVLKTRWPVSDASTPVLAVSKSRISPTMITSGSARRNERSAFAKVQSIFGFICTWRRPGCVISIGSSAVQILRSGTLMCESAECSVVVLPAPVGPTHSTMP
jgi:hypothetical protein